MGSRAPAPFSTRWVHWAWFLYDLGASTCASVIRLAVCESTAP
jgi:hypothetical protein